MRAMSSNSLSATQIPEEIVKEHARLSTELWEHSRRYYLDNNPTISDVEYDNMLVRLRKIEDAYPSLVTPSSPTQRVGFTPLSEFPKVVRKVPMLSLDNTYSPTDLQEFHDRVIKGLENEEPLYIVEPKIDGISIELTYQNGVYVQGATRGDGTTGELITDNLRTVRNLPIGLKEPVSVVVRGEAYIEREALLTINRDRIAAGEEPFKNPRNAAGGSLKLLDPKLTAKRPIKIWLYDLQD